MQVIENLLQKMQQTPSFRPMSADTFSDWSIEAGDIISVDADGVVHPFPVFTSGLDWVGAAKSTLSCDGGQARQPLRKQERREAAAFGAVSREIAKTDKKILEARNELIAALTGADGAPEDLASGLQNYVRYDLANKEGYAESKLFAQIGEKSRAEIGVYAVKSGDTTKTFAQILADQITLESAVDDTNAKLELKADGKQVDTLEKRVVTTEEATAELKTRVGEAEASLAQKAEAKTVEDVSGRVTKVETAQTEILNRVGDAETALTQKAEKSTVTALDGKVNNVASAQAALSTKVDEAEASLSLKASKEEVKTVDGKVTAVSGSVAELKADVIQLQGDTEILGNLTVDGGKLRVSKSIATDGAVDCGSLEISSNKATFGVNDLYVQTEVALSANAIRLGQNIYKPTQITSTTGTVLVLGIA